MHREVKSEKKNIQISQKAYMRKTLYLNKQRKGKNLTETRCNIKYDFKLSES